MSTQLFHTSSNAHIDELQQKKIGASQTKAGILMWLSAIKKKKTCT
jgi:hypothetical protein